MYDEEHFGPTMECERGRQCIGCHRCARLKTLVGSVRKGDRDAATELARRVEGLMTNNECKPGSAGDWVRRKLEPIPAVALDAMETAKG